MLERRKSLPPQYRRVLRTIDVLVDLLIGEIDGHAPIAFDGVQAERDRIVAQLEAIPGAFADWWRRDYSPTAKAARKAAGLPESRDGV